MAGVERWAVDELYNIGVSNREAVLAANPELVRLLRAHPGISRGNTFYFRNVGAKQLHGNMTFPQFICALYRLAQMEPHFGLTEQPGPLLDLVESPGYEAPPLRLNELECGWAEDVLQWIDRKVLLGLSRFSDLGAQPDHGQGQVYGAQWTQNPAKWSSPDSSLYGKRCDFIPPFLFALMQNTGGSYPSNYEFRGSIYRGEGEQLAMPQDAEEYITKLLEDGLNPALEMVSVYDGRGAPDTPVVWSFFHPAFERYHTQLRGYIGGSAAWDNFNAVMVGDKAKGYRPWVRAANTNGALRRHYIHMFEKLDAENKTGQRRYQLTKRIVDELVPVWKQMERETAQRSVVMGIREDTAKDVEELDPERQIDRYYLSDLPEPLMADIFRYMKPSNGDENDQDGDDRSAKRSRADAALKAVLVHHGGDVRAAFASLTVKRG